MCLLSQKSGKKRKNIFENIILMGKTHPALLGSTDLDKNWQVGSFWCVDKQYR
jgi:hypothetical protein